MSLHCTMQLPDLIRAWTKWPPIFRHFQMHLYWMKSSYFDAYFSKFVPKSAIDNASTSVQVQLSINWLYHGNDNETVLEPTTFSYHIWVNTTLPHTGPYTTQLPDRNRAFIKIKHVSDYKPGLVYIHFLDLWKRFLTRGKRSFMNI